MIRQKQLAYNNNTSSIIRHFHAKHEDPGSSYKDAAITKGKCNLFSDSVFPSPVCQVLICVFQNRTCKSGLESIFFFIYLLGLCVSIVLLYNLITCFCCVMGNRKEITGEALLDMIVKDCQPFSIEGDVGFKNFVSLLDPNCILPMRKALKTMLVAKFKEETEKARGGITEGHSSQSGLRHVDINPHGYLSSCHLPFCGQ